VLAGALTTAACGAANVVVLVRLFRRLGLSEPVVAGLTLTYCLNPVVIFYCANGMSEASFYLAASVFLLGIVQWYKEGGPRSLILMSMGLGATMAIREEAVFLVPLVGVLVGLGERGWARKAKLATLVALPGLFVFALWTFANWLIMGNPLFWFESGSGLPPNDAPWLPKHASLASATGYSLGFLWGFVPALFIVVPLLILVVRTRRGRWELTAILGATAVIPGLVTLLVASRQTWGDPRYYATTTIYATVLLAYAAREVVRRPRLSRFTKRALCVALVGLGALDAVSGTYSDSNPRRTLVEQESIAFRAALGLPSPGVGSQQFSLPAWQRFDNYIDPHLSRGQLIMIDTGVAFEGPLLSRDPGHWVIPSDRDFQSLAENFSGQFQWCWTRLRQNLTPKPQRYPKLLPPRMAAIGRRPRTSAPSSVSCTAGCRLVRRQPVLTRRALLVVRLTRFGARPRYRMRAAIQTSAESAPPNRPSSTLSKSGDTTAISATMTVKPATQLVSRARKEPAAVRA
jgi:hypothetical protein